METCNNCHKPIEDKALPYIFNYEVVCKKCWAHLSEKKPDASNSFCDQCGKEITGKAKAYDVNGRTVCAHCRRQLTEPPSPTRPATSRQIEFLKNLGFSDADAFTFNQASYTLDHAQEIKYYAFQVARDEWSRDLRGLDLRPLVVTVFADKSMCDEIYEIMSHGREVAFAKQAELDAANVGNPKYEQPFYTEFIPPLARGKTFGMIRTGLNVLFHFDAEETSFVGSFSWAAGRLVGSILKIFKRA